MAATKRPTYVTVIGICMIVFGVFGVIDGVQTSMYKEMGTMFDEVKRIPEEALQSMEDDWKIDSLNMVAMDSAVNWEVEREKHRILVEQRKRELGMTENMMENFTKMPEIPWYWGLFKGVTFGFYFLVGILLLTMKRASFIMAPIALGLAIVVELSMAIFIMNSDAGVFGGMITAGNWLSVVIDAALLIVFLVNRHDRGEIEDFDTDYLN